MNFFTLPIDGYPVWIVLLICVGVFLAAFMDAIAGGGGIISVPTYMLGLNGIPTYFILGTNKLSSCVGTVFSTARYIRKGYVKWAMILPAVVLSLLGSVLGTWLQHHTPDLILKYLLLLVLPVVAFFTLQNKNWRDIPDPIDSKKQTLIVWTAALVIGAYDGYYGPGTGTFLMIVFIRLAKMDTRMAAGSTKVLNLSSNIGGVFSAWQAGYILWGVGLCAAGASILGHYLGAGLAIKNGSKIVRPTIIVVLILMTVKILSELLFPGFWA